MGHPVNFLNAIPNGVAVPEVGRVLVAGVSLEVKQVKINATAAGNTQVVAGVSTKKLRVLGLSLIAAAPVTIEWRTGTTTTIQDGQAFAANGGIVAYPPHGHLFETVAGDALNINLGVAANVRGSLLYVEV